MKKVHGLFALTMAVLALVGCGNKADDRKGPVETLTLNGAEYLPIDKAGLKPTATSVSGSGSLVFRLPTGEDNNYKLTFTLEKGGSLTLVTNSDKDLKSGANVRFMRDANDKPVVHLTTDGKTCDPVVPACELSADFADLPVTGTIELVLDVHGHGHVVSFDAGGNVKEHFSMDKVAGTLWGLKLQNASVTRAVIAAPMDPH